MGMDWLKGLVGSTGGMIPAGQAPPAAWTPYQPQGQHPGGPPLGGGPPIGGASPPGAWGGPPQQAQGPAGGADARVAALEARCDELRRDIESIALFAKTLLSVLEEKQVTNQQHFLEVKRRLDMLDGKLDDR